jgi:hypothetical protein
MSYTGSTVLHLYVYFMDDNMEKIFHRDLIEIDPLFRENFTFHGGYGYYNGIGEDKQVLYLSSFSAI